MKKGSHLSKEAKQKISIKNKGRHLSKETRQKISEHNARYWLGKKIPLAIIQKTRTKLLGRKLTKAHIEILRNSIKGNKNPMKKSEIREKVRKANLGKRRAPETIQKMKDSWKLRKNYKGITLENKKIRNNIEYRLWREAVFARDNWTCQKCNERGGKLRAHHINNFAQFPELRFAIDNGITLCDKCHIEFHQEYGCKNNNKIQIEKFLSKNNIL